MAEEFQAGICRGNWWNTARNESSPCTTAIADIGSFGWSNEMGGDMKCVTRSSDESVSSNSIMMGFGLSLPTLDWNQSLFGRNNVTTEQNFNTMLEQDLQPRSNFDQESHGMESVPIQKEWSPKNYSDRSEDSFSQLNQVALALDGHRNGLNSSKSCFPIGPSTTLLPSLFESDPQPQSQQHPYETTPMSYQMNLNEVSPWEKFPQFIKAASQKQHQNSNLHFAKNTPFWSASAGVMNNVGSTFSPSPQTQIPSSSFGEKPKCTSLAVKLNTEEVRKSGLKRGSTQEPTFKRPRIETPSPLPIFKVRKEKLGDRITALQQLVSPFGKTDTASVLYEAIEYIKFLHDKVHVLSTPYMKNAAHIQHQQSSDKVKDNEGMTQDLRNRGLCLVPISSTFPVAESPTDFWTPTFGGTYC